MAEQGGSDLKNTNSQNASRVGIANTSTPALWSIFCDKAGLIILFCSIISMILSVAGLSQINESTAIIMVKCALLCSLLTMILGLAGLFLRRLKWKGLAGTGFVLSALLCISLPRVMPIPGLPKERIAKYQISEFESALQAYGKEYGSLPTDRQGLEELVSTKGKGPFLRKSIPNDPWGRPYHYRNPGIYNPDSYDLWSNGYDDSEGTEDDIANWK
jgi:general secretion pathway protein G